MEAIRIVLAAASMLLVMMMMIIISSASVELTEEAPSPSSTTTAAAAFSAPLHRSDNLFTMQFSIGGTKVSGIVDTGSELVWTNNSQLLDADPEKCPASNDNDDGITWRNCDGFCTFNQKYGSGDVIVRGVMGKAKLTFGGGGSAATATSSGGVVNDDLTIGSALIFGCHRHHLSSSDDVLNTGEENKACKSYARGGIVGLNRGALSLLKQLGRHSFSYCLPRHEDEKTTTAQIKFYDDTAAAASSLDGTVTTLNLDDPAATGKAFRNHYVVGLKQIQVGRGIVKVPADDSCSSPDKDRRRHSLDDGAMNMIIDSGSKYSMLPKKVLQCVTQHVDNLLEEKTGKEIKDIAVRSNGEESSCYVLGDKYPDKMDSIKLDFYDNKKEGGTKTMEIPPENYLEEKTAKGGKIFCLAFKGFGKKWSILGAYQQQDMNMVFDIREGENTLTFAKSIACGGKSQSQEENHATM